MDHSRERPLTALPTNSALDSDGVSDRSSTTLRPEYEIVKSQQLNVMLVGRSGSGKSTIIKTLLDPGTPVSLSGYSDTKEPSVETLTVTHLETGRKVQLNIVDTCGLEERFKVEEKRSNDEILNLALKCIKFNLTQLHAVCFVTVGGRTFLNDLGVFEKLKTFLGDEMASCTFMVLTNMEDHTEKKFMQFVDELRSSEPSKPYMDYCKMGTLAVGAVDMDKLEKYKEVDEEFARKLRDLTTTSVTKMRSKLIEALVKADKPIHISALHAVAKDLEEQQQKQLQAKLKSMSVYDKFAS